MFDPTIPVLPRERLTNDALAELKAKYPDYDEAYVASACIEERRLVLDDAYETCKSYLDDCFTTEAWKPEKFMDRLWELALCSILLHKGYTLEKWSRTSKARPDFCILIEGKKIWVEAACPARGEIDPVPTPPVLTPGVIYSETIDITKDLRPRALRASSAFTRKALKRERYLKGGLMKEDEPFLIALNTNRITRLSDPRVEELMLYGMGLHQRTHDGVWSRQWIPEIKKKTDKGEVPVPMAYFLREEYRPISGVIFFNKWFEFSPDWRDAMAESATTYFNSRAYIPIEKNHITFGKRRYSEETGNRVELKDI
jgi:hypothetical protein